MSRVQVEDIAPGRPMQVQQRVPDTYEGYQKPVQDQNLERLSSALSSFSDTLGNAAARMNRTSPIDQRKAEVEKYIASTSHEQRLADVAAGKTMYWDVPTLREIHTVRLGNEAADRILNPFKERIASGEIPVVDGNGVHIDYRPGLEALAADHFKSIGVLAKDPSYTKAFNEKLFAQSNEIDSLARSKRAEVAQKTFEGTTQALLNNVVTNAADPNVKDEDLAKLLNGIKAGVNGQFGMTYQKQDELLIGRVKEIVEKNPEAAARILDLDRGGGADGKAVYKRLRDNPTFTADIQTLDKQINEGRKTAYDKRIQNEAIDKAYQSLNAGDGSFNAVRDFSYENPFDLTDKKRKIDAGQLREWALAKSNTDDARAAQSQGLSPQAVERDLFEKQYTRYVGSNISNPNWAKPMTDAGTLLTNPQAASQPENMQRLQAAKRTYEELSARNPGYVSETLKVGGRTEKVFTTARLYQDLLGYPEDVAMQSAITSVTNEGSALSKQAKERVETVVNELSDNTWTNMFGSNKGLNKVALRKQVIEIATAVTAESGLDPQEVVKKVGEQLGKRSVVLNGQAFVGSALVTKENVPAWQERLDLIVQANPLMKNSMGEVVRKGDELSVQQVPNTNQFRVVDRNGFPVVAPRVDENGKAGSYAQLFIDGTEVRQIAGRREFNQRSATAAEQDINANKRNLRQKLSSGPVGNDNPYTTSPDQQAANDAKRAEIDAARRQTRDNINESKQRIDALKEADKRQPVRDKQERQKRFRDTLADRVTGAN